jgi:CDI immunity proteins
MVTLNYSKSLEQLEQDYWGDPTYDSYVVKTCHSMRKKPLSEVSVEELRLVIGQGFSLDYLMPVVIKLLKQDILTEGDLYEGDLLANAISERTFNYWTKNKPNWDIVASLIQQNKNLLTDPSITKKILGFLDIHRP